MKRLIRLCSVPLCLLLLTACGSDHDDLFEYMEAQKGQTGGDVWVLPTPQPYKTATYDAFLLRSPFEEPELLTIAGRPISGKKALKPDSSRVPEYLEQINFSSFSMVGSISQGGQIWSLLNDGTGTIHRVTVGNYLGKNHGQIISIGQEKMDVIEIISDGRGGWLEKPRVLSLDVKE